MLDRKLFESKVSSADTYTEYLEKFRLNAENVSQNPQSTNPNSQNIKLNFQRSSRILKTYKVKPELCEKINRINKPLIWLVITEDWCGDSAQNLPYIANIVMCSELMDLRVIERDKNLEIMDNYLTDGKSRSIPKVIVFDQEGNELFQWGPRPQKAKELVEQAKADGKSKEEFLHELHLWYAKDKGQELEKEIDELLDNLLIYSSDLKGK